MTQDVHYRDILAQLMEDEIDTVNDFSWQKQLKYYLDGDDLYAQQITSRLEFGFEYYGATSRLVITPLTDKCWLTISEALHIKLGTNPQGPAGTGKTESCKDLAKGLGLLYPIIAKFCLVFNCSDQVNVKMMEKLFIGLAYTGSWSCFDEFNRISREVLSVIAQQVLSIRQLLLSYSSLSNYVFQGKILKTMNPQLGIFITMNPTYTGRNQLPDNLQILFRPVAMNYRTPW